MQCAREEAYIGKVTRGLMTARAVEAARGNVKFGGWVTVREHPENALSNKRILSGEVMFKNEHFFTIQTKHYREAFSFVNVALGQVEID